MKYIPRNDYLQFLISHKDKKVVKVVSGIRRSGKSTLFEIYKDYLLKNGVDREQIVSINLEDISYQDKTYKELYYEIKGRLIEGKMVYVFLDEIQNCINFEKMVDSLYIQDNVDIYITVSNAYFMSGELATLLSGRYVELKMLPLSFEEYVSNTDSSKSLLKKYYDYITYSSFPYALQYQNDLKAVQDYLRGIYSTILLKDVIQRYKITDVMMLEIVSSFVFDNIGRRLSSNRIANDKTIEKYLKALMDSLLIYQVKRYNIKGKQLLQTQAKYYIADLGLRYLLFSIKGQDEGHILENVIYLELLRRGYQIAIGQNDENEIDFVASDNHKTMYIQVTLSMKDEYTYKREITPLKSLNNSYPKYVLTLDEAPIKDDEGIKIIYALDFLINKDL